jgi:hypothetical protein
VLKYFSAVECPKLTPYWHSSILGCSPPFIVGSVCAQICHDGYTSDNSGAGQRVCTTDGTWSGQELICVKYETVPPKGHLNSKGLIKYSCLALELFVKHSVYIIFYYILLFIIFYYMI